MRDFGLNKIFVEGETDKIFIDALLKKYYNIEEKELVIDIGGKDKLKYQPFLSDTLRKIKKSKNIIIFDTDYKEKGGGRDKRIEEYKTLAKSLDIQFELFLMPYNDDTEGEVEDLIKTCFKKKFDFFDNCWDNMMHCFNQTTFQKSLNLPANEGFLFSKIDLLQHFRENKKWNNKLTNYDYTDKGYLELRM